MDEGIRPVVCLRTAVTRTAIRMRDVPYTSDLKSVGGLNRKIVGEYSGCRLF